MNIREEQLGDQIYKISIAGRMDMAGMQAIDIKFSGMTASPRKGIVVDLSEVTFLASLGIRTLVMGAKALDSRGGKLVILNPQTSVAKVLESAGVDTFIQVHHDQAAAQTAVAG